MKRLLFTSVLVICFSVCKAQLPGIGIQAGISQSDFHIRYTEKLFNTNFPEELNFQPAFFAYYGVNITVWKNNYFSLRPGFSLLHKGFEDRFYLTDDRGSIAGTANVRERVRYASLNADLTFGKEYGNIRPYIIAGLRIDDMLNQQSRIGDNDYVKTRYSYTKTLYGMNTGLGAAYKLSNLFSVNAEAIYRWMFTSVYKPSPSLQEAYHRCYTLTLGLQYAFPKKEIFPVDPEIN